MCSEEFEHAENYNWSDNPVGNLYNEAGLPMLPFRTDNFPGMTEYHQT